MIEDATRPESRAQDCQWVEELRAIVDDVHPEMLMDESWLCALREAWASVAKQRSTGLILTTMQSQEFYETVRELVAQCSRMYWVAILSTMRFQQMRISIPKKMKEMVRFSASFICDMLEHPDHLPSEFIDLCYAYLTYNMDADVAERVYSNREALGRKYHWQSLIIERLAYIDTIPDDQVSQQAYRDLLGSLRGEGAIERFVRAVNRIDIRSVLPMLDILQDSRWATKNVVVEAVETLLQYMADEGNPTLAAAAIKLVMKHARWRHLPRIQEQVSKCIRVVKQDSSKSYDLFKAFLLGSWSEPDKGHIYPYLIEDDTLPLQWAVELLEGACMGREKIGVPHFEWFSGDRATRQRQQLRALWATLLSEQELRDRPALRMGVVALATSNMPSIMNTDSQCMRPLADLYDLVAGCILENAEDAEWAYEMIRMLLDQRYTPVLKNRGVFLLDHPHIQAILLTLREDEEELKRRLCREQVLATRSVTDLIALVDTVIQHTTDPPRTYKVIWNIIGNEAGEIYLTLLEGAIRRGEHWLLYDIAHSLNYWRPKWSGEEIESVRRRLEALIEALQQTTSPLPPAGATYLMKVCNVLAHMLSNNAAAVRRLLPPVERMMGVTIQRHLLGNIGDQ